MGTSNQCAERGGIVVRNCTITATDNELNVRCSVAPTGFNGLVIDIGAVAGVEGELFVPCTVAILKVYPNLGLVVRVERVSDLGLRLANVDTVGVWGDLDDDARVVFGAEVKGFDVLATTGWDELVGGIPLGVRDRPDVDWRHAQVGDVDFGVDDGHKDAQRDAELKSHGRGSSRKDRVEYR
jgi:hypothetical protein